MIKRVLGNDPEVSLAWAVWTDGIGSGRSKEK